MILLLRGIKDYIFLPDGQHIFRCDRRLSHQPVNHSHRTRTFNTRHTTASTARMYALKPDGIYAINSPLLRISC